LGELAFANPRRRLFVSFIELLEILQHWGPLTDFVRKIWFFSNFLPAQKLCVLSKGFRIENCALAFWVGFE
jgi:hypothetical protein